MIPNVCPRRRTVHGIRRENWEEMGMSYMQENIR